MDRKEGLLARVPRDLPWAEHQIDVMGFCEKARRNSCQGLAAHVRAALSEVSEVSKIMSHNFGGQVPILYLGLMIEDLGRGDS